MEVIVIRSGNGKSSETFYVTEKYFWPLVPPAMLPTYYKYLYYSLSLMCVPGEIWWPVLQKGFLGLPLAPSLSADMRGKKSLNSLLWERDSKGILRLAVSPKVGARAHLSLSCSSVSGTLDEPRVVQTENPGVDGVNLLGSGRLWDGEGTMINWRGQVCLQRQLCLAPDNWCQCTGIMGPSHVSRESRSLQILNIEN